MSRYSTIKLSNPHIDRMGEDTLYHLGLNTKSNDLKAMFGDVKFVCMGGSAKRMKNFAHLVAKKLSLDTAIEDISGHADRYSMYKVGPVISVNHGIGVSSLLVVLHELFKLLKYAQCKDVTVFRIGTSGGIGVKPGTVVLTESAVDECLNDKFEIAVAGVKVQRLAGFDKILLHELRSVAKDVFKFPLRVGKTMTAMDFYEGQGRLDGAICHYNEGLKMNYLKRLAEEGVLNIEMEALALGAFCKECNVKGAVVTVTLLDRLLGDQVSMEKSTKEDWELRPQLLVAEFIQRRTLESRESNPN